MAVKNRIGVKLENLPRLSNVVRFGLGSKETAERDLARLEARGEKPVRVKGAKIRPI
jgi:hypothetical protein